MISMYLRRLDPRRSVLRLLAGLMATWAFAGAFGLITGAVPLRPVIVEKIPWHSPILAGVALALWVGLPMTVVALTVNDDAAHNAQTTMVAAAALIGWVLLQLGAVQRDQGIRTAAPSNRPSERSSNARSARSSG
ncbi:hypothetical protein [Nocardia rhizosphaerae]|uniref:Uncharacterized protein n=1 Tax=Nocardia rhizosphaerae TaxID=1691571 RepID=A0ABV8LB04_9NOCA